MMKIKNFYKRFRRSVRAVSPVIAVLLMIVIAVAASLFAYSWTMGYLDFLTVKTDQGVQIQGCVQHAQNSHGQDNGQKIREHGQETGF